MLESALKLKEHTDSNITARRLPSGEMRDWRPAFIGSLYSIQTCHVDQCYESK